MSDTHNKTTTDLLHTNALLRTVIDENPNIILMKDWDGKFLIGNRALANLYGTTPDQLVGKDDGAFNPNEAQVAFYLKNVREIMSQHETKVVMEESTDANTGETRYYQSIKKPLVTEDGKKQILVIANDVTELKNAQRKLEESERRLRYVLEATREGVWDWDIRSGIVSHNNEWCRITGLDDGYLSHPVEKFSELLHEEDRPSVFSRLQHCMAGNGPYQSEHRMRLASGQTVWVLDRGDVVERDAEGKPLRMVGSFVEINDRKSSELALALRTELLNAIFELSPDGFVSFDNQSNVSYVNPAFTRMTEIGEKQWIGLDEHAFVHTLNAICHSNCGLKGISQLREISSSKEPEARQFIELSLPSKRILEILLRQSNSSTVSKILYFRDVTHESEVDRMKSEFLSTAAHELRTPMASIYGFTELLMSQHDLSETERNEFQSTIFKQAGLMVSIINELLDIARIEARRGKDFIITRFELPRLLQEVITGFKFTDGRTCKLKAESNCSVWIKADRKKITQAINNILSNAFKYSSPDNDVLLEIICPANPPTSTGTEAMVGIRVIDNGIGLTPTQLNHVFDRFYRADNSGKIPGTGLGMSIVKEIVELHGGQVGIESVYGKGSAVTIWLPYDKQE